MGSIFNTKYGRRIPGTDEPRDPLNPEADPLDDHGLSWEKPEDTKKRVNKVLEEAEETGEDELKGG